VYFEAAAVIVTLVLLGQVLELRARSETELGDPRAPRARPEDGAAHRSTRRERTCRSMQVASAIGCASAQGRRSPSMGVVLEGGARSTSRW
jgi:cation transport ATPase